MIPIRELTEKEMSEVSGGGKKTRSSITNTQTNVGFFFGSGNGGKAGANQTNIAINTIASVPYID
jgi:bacteriocin-like protein